MVICRSQALAQVRPIYLYFGPRYQAFRNAKTALNIILAHTAGSQAWPVSKLLLPAIAIAQSNRMKEC